MISVIVCTYNRSAMLQEMLNSMKHLFVPSGLEWELIVVDNNSPVNTREVVESFAKQTDITVRYLFEARQGKSFALNCGIRNANGDILAFTDDDVTVDPKWLAGLSKCFSEFDCSGIGGRIVPVWTQPKPRWLELEGPYGLNPAVIVKFEHGEKPIEISIPPVGANMAFRKDVFQKYGLFRTDLGPVGDKGIHGFAEDTEICTRLIEAGERIFYCPGAVIYHPVEPKRVTKAYLLESSFLAAKGSVRAGGWPRDAVCYFGVPRFMLRSAVARFFQWMFCFQPTQRFYHKVKLWQEAGRIAEAFRQSKDENGIAMKQAGLNVHHRNLRP